MERNDTTPIIGDALVKDLQDRIVQLTQVNEELQRYVSELEENGGAVASHTEEFQYISINKVIDRSEGFIPFQSRDNGMYNF